MKDDKAEIKKKREQNRDKQSKLKQKRRDAKQGQHTLWVGDANWQLFLEIKKAFLKDLGLDVISNGTAFEILVDHYFKSKKSAGSESGEYKAKYEELKAAASRMLVEHANYKDQIAALEAENTTFRERLEKLAAENKTIKKGCDQLVKVGNMMASKRSSAEVEMELVVAQKKIAYLEKENKRLAGES